MKLHFHGLDERLFAATIDGDYADNDPMVELARDAVARVDALENALNDVFDEIPEWDELRKIKSVVDLRSIIRRSFDILNAVGDDE